MGGGGKRQQGPRSLPRPARAWLAFSLSLAAPGTGQLYAGEGRRAAAALVAALGLLIPAAFASLAALPPRLGAAAWAVAGCFALVVPLDAARCAWRRPVQRPPPVGRTAVRRTLLVLSGMAGAALLLRAETDWVRGHWLTLYRTPTWSMAPALLPHDVFLVDVRPSARADAGPGDVVVFDRGDTAFAKRVVAGAGSRVEISGGRLHVDGVPHTQQGRRPDGLRWEEIGEHRYPVWTGRANGVRDFGPVWVPEGHVFVLGDFRTASEDSRGYGAIPLAWVRGRVLHVLWSTDPARGIRWKRIGHGVGR